eukprot:s701_g29.t1
MALLALKMWQLAWRPMEKEHFKEMDDFPCLGHHICAELEDEGSKGRNSRTLESSSCRGNRTSSWRRSAAERQVHGIGHAGRRTADLGIALVPVQSVEDGALVKSKAMMMKLWFEAIAVQRQSVHAISACDVEISACDYVAFGTRGIQALGSCGEDAISACVDEISACEEMVYGARNGTLRSSERVRPLVSRNIQFSEA